MIKIKEEIIGFYYVEESIGLIYFYSFFTHSIIQRELLLLIGR